MVSHGKSRGIAVCQTFFFLPIGEILMATVSFAAERGEFEKPNRVLRKGALAYGDRFYDQKYRLVRRTDHLYDGRMNTAQQSPEYAGALSGYAAPGTRGYRPRKHHYQCDT